MTLDNDSDDEVKEGDEEHKETKDVTTARRRVIGAPRPQCHSPISIMAIWEMRMVDEPINGFVDSLLTCDEQGDANTPF